VVIQIRVGLLGGQGWCQLLFFFGPGDPGVVWFRSLSALRGGNNGGFSKIALVHPEVHPKITN
jgi:hypothetical protein